MSGPARRRHTERIQLGVRQKFLAAVGVLIAAVLLITAAAAVGLARMAADARRLYVDDVATAQHSSDLVAATLTVHESALYELATNDPETEARLTIEMQQQWLPAVSTAVATLRADLGSGPAARASIAKIQAGIERYLEIRRVYTRDGVRTPAAVRSALVDQTDETLGGVADVAKGLNQQAQQQELVSRRMLEDTYRSTQRLLAASVALVLLLGMAVVLALSRSLLPRIQRYAAFATDVAAGRVTAPLAPRGHDELTALGAALNDMVAQRELASLSASRQTEFVEMLQVIGSQDEAHLLIQRHLRRSVPVNEVVVLRRNNSANRLEIATDVPPDSEFADRPIDFEPNACVALRLARTHTEGGDGQALLGCTVCSRAEGFATCEPLLVSGEVIGSVLVTHLDPLDPAERNRIRSTVAQASPTLGNLRNLALAEYRASNDPLTGLPNKRAAEDTLKRTVAYANRGNSALSAIMLDLDHFKEVNDRFGHPMGDEVLAAVGVAIRSCLREGDFAGRFGGEEFLILLPNTERLEAAEVAERIRRVVGSVKVPGVDRYISASLGVADLALNATSSAGLLRSADRAQYEAKATGRNRVVLAEGPTLAGDIPAPRTEPDSSDGAATVESTASLESDPS